MTPNDKRIILSSLLGMMWLAATAIYGDRAAAADQTVIWSGQPLAVKIPVGTERVFKFDGQRIQVALPTDLWGIATAESSQGIVYLRSSRAFENVRVRFRDKDSGQIYSANVSAVEGAAVMPPLIITNPSPAEIDHAEQASAQMLEALAEQGLLPTGAGESVAENVIEPAETLEPEAPPVPIRHGIPTLVRFAMQHVYAPERLIEELPDVYRIALDGTDREIELVPGTRVKSRVLGQWNNEGRYVTAVYLQNMTPETVELDPRVLTGRHYWQIAAMMHSVLTPANTYGDSTTLVAVSDRRWTEYSKWLR